MKLTATQMEEMKEAAAPLVFWMSENTHPHCKAIVQEDSIVLVEDVARMIYPTS